MSALPQHSLGLWCTAQQSAQAAVSALGRSRHTNKHKAEAACARATAAGDTLARLGVTGAALEHIGTRPLLLSANRRNGLMCCTLDAHTTLTLNTRTGTFALQRRGFRAQRTTTGLGGGSRQQSEQRTLGTALANIFSATKNQSLAQKEAEAAGGVDKLKKMLASQDSSEDRDRIKIAFADGFIAGTNETSGQSKPNFAQRFKSELKFMAAFAVIVYIFYRMSDFSFTFGFPSHHEVDMEDVDVTFDDARGVDEAKDDLTEIVSYLREPEKYSRLGARLPKGVLLVGSPGTGKTLLARAIAGEAGVPIFYASGSEFDEALVGQGARRIRDLFAAAKARAPCVVFIDELDSVGSKRTGSALHPYASQTINQLLTEMDGFNKNEGIIVIGATNRRDDLDKALLRPGRFDVEIDIPRPDLKGRTDIFTLYLDKVVRGSDVDITDLAKRTVGFTGAQIENVVNQAALRAAADGCESVDMLHLNEAKDRIMMGRERKAGRIPDEEANKATAYHEAGHALVAYYTKDAAPLHKCTIIPRGGSMGHTAFTPEKDEYSVRRSQLVAQMDTAMGGRVAEELIFGPDHVTTGAGDDLKQATRIATMMVKNFGMSDKVGLRDFDVLEEGGSIFGGRPGSELGPQAAQEIDSEIRRLLQESYERAKAILMKQSAIHHRLAEALLLHETLDASEIRAVIDGKKLHETYASQAKLHRERLIKTPPSNPPPSLPHPLAPIKT